MFEPKRKRPPTPQSIKTKVLQRSRGKCERCHKEVIGRGLKPRYHHKDGDPFHNTLSNVVLLCNDCHDKVHEYRTVTESDMLGFTHKRRVMVAKRIKKPGRKKKKTRRRKKTNKKEPAPWDVKIPEVKIPKVEIPSFDLYGSKKRRKKKSQFGYI